MNTTTLPPNTILVLLRSLGMLLQQAGMYGMGHNVAALALRETFAQFESTLAVYGTINLIKTGNTLLVNGQPVDTKDAIVHHVSQKITNNNLSGLVFKPEMNIAEFTTFAKLFSSSPAALNQLGGMKHAIENAGLSTIATSETTYKQVNQTEEITSKAKIRHTGVIDLSEAFSDTAPPPLFNTASEQPAHEAKITQAQHNRRKNIEKIAAMLRATATLIENEGALPDELGQQQVLASIERILKLVETSSRETRAQIAKLAGQVNADRQTIASIESAARKKGIGFNLTRKELLEHFSEINQEMLQPITVSSGALDLLLSEKAGTLTPSQKELIKLAFEGMQRTNQLVEFTNRISGLPESYTPDQKLIRKSYS